MSECYVLPEFDHVFFCLLLNSFFFLFLENYGVRKLEGVFAIFIGTMGFSFAWMFFDTKPSEEELLMGKISLLLFIRNTEKDSML
jgi:hypothetical protein